MLGKKGFAAIAAVGILLLASSARAHTEDVPFVADLLAGRHMDAGEVRVWNDGDNLHVEYRTIGGWHLYETHLAVATSLADIPQRKGNPPPGRFAYKHEDLDGASSDSYVIELADLGADADTLLYIAAHAEVRGREELVQNGGFEAPVVTTPEGWDIFDSGTAGLCWIVQWYDGARNYGGETRPEPAHLELHSEANNWTPYEGDQYAELDADWDGPSGALTGEPASVEIYQDLQTEAGAVYTLSYAFSPRPGNADNVLLVEWDGQPFNQQHSASGVGLSDTSWTEFTHTVTATSSSTCLSFTELGSADSLGSLLDGVSVLGVEEQEESAWGDGYDFPGKNWATYITYTVQ